ncbi:hypothetical protein [Neobacillus drentensis]|uniref:hypothetical protein n=1 Tax=Neobacillus drentensis TaxID=220684 RepID=UPI002FFDB203
MEKTLSKCELCERSENEVVLLKYPFTTIYKNIETDTSHVDPDATICVECLVEDLNEVRKESK